jgi:hypothetical protein
MILTLELTIVCGSPEEAVSLQTVLSPDNKSVPKGQSFSSSTDGRTLSFLISSPKVSGCVSSALSILTDARLFQDVWSLTA